jgi:hypothetical protein
MANPYKIEQIIWKNKDYYNNDEEWWVTEDSRLVDFSRERSRDNRITQTPLGDLVGGCAPILGLDGYDGFFFVPGGISEESRVRLAWSCLNEYCEPPHDTNIDQVPMKEDEVEGPPGFGMWRNHVEGLERRGTKETYYKCLGKLSWSTMGWNYDWTLRAYHEGKRSPFPLELADLSLELAKACGHRCFSPQASIVNFYHTKSLPGQPRIRFRQTCYFDEYWPPWNLSAWGANEGREAHPHSRQVRMDRTKCS